MKMLFMLIALSGLCSCAAIRPETAFRTALGTDKEEPQYRYDWGLDRSNKAVMDKFNQDKRECEDKAFNLRAIGSKYTEWDLALGCMERRGYKLSKFAVK